MLLPDHEIVAAMRSGLVGVHPFDRSMLQPASIDVRLDDGILVFDTHKCGETDPYADQSGATRMVLADGDDGVVLHPGEFVLGSTIEVISLSDGVAGRLEGKSSLGRLGLVVHSTAGFIDPGFSGTVTLELSNISRVPVRLRPGMPIGQVCFYLLSSPCQNPYGSDKLGSRYQGQAGATASRFHWNRASAPGPGAGGE